VQNGSSNYEKVLEIGNKKNVKFHVSIFTEHLEILLTESENLSEKPVYVIYVDEYAPTTLAKRTRISQCSVSQSTGYMHNCRIIHTIVC